MSPVLLQRLVSGLSLAAIMLGVITLCGTEWVAVLFALLFLLGSWEWARLTSIASTTGRTLYVGGVAVLLVLAWLLRDSDWARWWLVLAVVCWFGAVILLSGYHRRSEQRPRWQMPLSLIGTVFISAAWLAVVKLHEMSYLWLLYVLVLIAIADSFAYFFGKRFGRHKLAPEISPGKTREGLWGGLGGVVVFAAIVAVAAGMPGVQSVSFVLLSLLAGLVSVEGDLFESVLKREAGVKDSGSILPGHGGILDRFDSHIAAAPVFLLGLQWISS